MMPGGSCCDSFLDLSIIVLSILGLVSGIVSSSTYGFIYRKVRSYDVDKNVPGINEFLFQYFKYPFIAIFLVSILGGSSRGTLDIMSFLKIMLFFLLLTLPSGFSAYQRKRDEINDDNKRKENKAYTNNVEKNK